MSILASLSKYAFKKAMDSIYDQTHSAKATKKALEHPAFKAHLTKVALEPQKFDIDGLKDYDKKRIKGHEGFSEIRDHEGKSIGDRLNADKTEAKNVRDKLKNCFQGNNELTTAIEEYRKSQEAFNTLCQQVSSKYSTQDLIESYKQYGHKAQKAQSQQQKKEKENLTNLFKNTDYVDSLKKSLTIDKKEDVETVKQNMLAKLEETHKEETETLNDTIKGNESLLNKAANIQHAMIVFLATQLKYGNKKMREQALQTLENMQKEQNLSMELGENTMELSTKDNFEGITLKYFTELETRKGRKIKKDEHYEDTGILSISFKNRWREPFFYLDPRHSVRSEIRDLVDLIKAAGHDTIEMRVNFSDPEMVEARAKDCAKAALEAGFEADKITILLNGQPKKLNELLNPNELEYYKIAQKEAAKFLKPEPIPQGSENATSAMKKSIQNIITIDEQKEDAENKFDSTPGTRR